MWQAAAFGPAAPAPEIVYPSRGPPGDGFMMRLATLWMMTRVARLAGLILAAIVSAHPSWAATVTPPPGELAGFFAALWPVASQQGVSRATFDQAFKGITIDPKVIGAT